MNAPQPDEPQDSTVDEWFGQSVDRDAELADRLTAEEGQDQAEQRFDELAEGEDVQERRRGGHIDPELGESAYREES